MATSSGRRRSTLDIIQGFVDVDSFVDTANTGDILLYGNPLKDKKLRWYMFIKATGGYATMTRRLPILHVSMVIKNPPPDVLEVHGLSPRDGNLFVFESTPAQKEGARVLPLQKYVEQELDPVAFPDGQLLLRQIVDTPQGYEPPPEFWDWIKEARGIPYSSTLDPESFFNLCFVPGGAVSVVRVLGDLVAQEVVEKAGGGAWAYCLGGILGLAVLGFMAITLLFNFILMFAYWCFKLLLFFFRRLYRCRLRLFKTTTSIKHRRRTSPSIYMSREHDQGKLEHMFCSKCLAETMVKAGIMMNLTPSNLYLPKDFLPLGVGAEGNLFNEHLEDGFEFSDDLLQVVPSIERRRSGSSRFGGLARAFSSRLLQIHQENDLFFQTQSISSRKLLIENDERGNEEQQGFVVRKRGLPHAGSSTKSQRGSVKCQIDEHVV